MAPREGQNPTPPDVRRRVSQRIAGAYFLFAGAWIVFSDLALFELTKDLPAFAGGSLIKGGAFVLVTTALLYLLVSYYLQRNPDPGTVAAVQPGERAPGLYAPIILFSVIALLAIALVVIMFSYESGQGREATRQQLNAILEVKADQVELLLEHRQATARSYARSRGMRQDLERLAGRSDPDIVSGITERIEFLRRDLDFDAVLALDSTGQVRAAAGPPELHQVSPELAAMAARSMATGTSISHFLHRDHAAPGASIVFDYVTPLSGDSPGAGNVGALVLRERAHGRLFRVVENWPTPSPTAETVLVRQDGNDVLYLTDVRHEKDSAFRMRRSLSQTDLVAVKALGTPGPLLSDGVDYRGVAVVGASRPIAGTDWFMIAKVDRDEVLAPVRRSAMVWLTSILCMTLFAAVGVLLMWRQQLRAAALHRRSGELERLVLVKHFDFLSKYANDLIFMLDESGRVIEINDRVVDMYGWQREELVGRSAFELRAPGHEAPDEELRRILSPGTGTIYETVHRRKDGSTFPVEISARNIEVEGRRLVQGIGRDITERKRAEARIERLTYVRKALSEVNRAIVHAESEEALFSEMCAIGVRHAGFVLAWIGIPDQESGIVLPVTSAGGPVGLEYLGRLSISWRDDGPPSGLGTTGTAVREGHTVIVNDLLGEGRQAPWYEAARAAGIRAKAVLPLRRKGAVVAALNVYSGTAGYFDAEIVDLLEEMAQDVSFSLDVLEAHRQHARSEEAIARLAAIVQSSGDAIVSRGMDGKILTWNAAAERMFGWSEQEAIGQPITIIVPPERRGEVRPLIDHVTAGAAVGVTESTHRRKDGTRINTSTTFSAIRDARGDVTAVSIIYRDITESKALERVAQDQARLTRMLESLARAANVASTPEAAIKACLIQICGYGNWALGGVGMFQPGHSGGVPQTTFWHPADAGPYAEFMAVSAGTDHMATRGHFVGRVLRERCPVWIPDVTKTGATGRIGLAARTGLRSAFAFPVIVGDEVAAFLEFFSQEPREPDQLMLDAVMSVSAQLARLIERERAQAVAMRLAAIVESSSDAIISRSLDRRILTWNPAAERLLGWSADEAIGQSVSMFIPPEYAAESSRNQALVQANQPVPAYDTVRRAKDGHDIDVSLSHSPILNERGETVAISLVLRDISERKRAELALRESEARFRAMLEQSIAAVYVIQDNRLVYANARMREIFGYGPEEPFDPDPLSHIQESERARAAEQMAQRLVAEPEAAYTIGARRKDGTLFSLGVHAKQTSFEGRPAIIAVAQDITEKAHAEEEIKRYVARLEQAMQSTINVVATIGELRDPYTHGHERRVGEIAAAIATEMGLDANQVEGIRIAGYLHDVGKIGVPAEILAKPSRLTKPEFDLVKSHAQQSYDILKTVIFPWPVAETAWQHHERLDGSGYPRGLKGDEIILEARILAVADVVEAMASHRPYRPGLGIDKALDEIEKNSGKFYEPQAVSACLRLFRKKAYQLPV